VRIDLVEFSPNMFLRNDLRPLNRCKSTLHTQRFVTLCYFRYCFHFRYIVTVSVVFLPTLRAVFFGIAIYRKRFISFLGEGGAQ